jgi:hypothetical protein
MHVKPDVKMYPEIEEKKEKDFNKGLASNI